MERNLSLGVAVVRAGPALQLHLVLCPGPPQPQPDRRAGRAVQQVVDGAAALRRVPRRSEEAIADLDAAADTRRQVGIQPRDQRGMEAVRVEVQAQAHPRLRRRSGAGKGHLGVDGELGGNFLGEKGHRSEGVAQFTAAISARSENETTS